MSTQSRDLGDVDLGDGGSGDVGSGVRARAARERLLRTLLLLTCVTACERAPAPTLAIRPAGTHQAFPMPPIAAMEPVVRAQIEDAQRECRRILADPRLGARTSGQALGTLGKVYHAYELLTAARNCYEQALALDPENPAWAYLAAHTHLDAGETAHAVIWLRRSLELAPDDAPALLHLARCQLQAADDLEAAETLFTRVLTRNSSVGKAAAHFGLGRIAATRDRHSVAIEHFEQVLRLQPAASEASYAMGLSQRALGNLEQAASHLQAPRRSRVHFSDPVLEEMRALASGARVHMNRGNVLFTQGDLQGAAEAFREALRIDPASVIAHSNLASLLVKSGHLDEGESHYRRALELDPEYGAAHFNLGTVRARRGDDAAAIQHYHRALALTPEDAALRFNLANALRRQGLFEDALDHYRYHLTREPANTDARLALALCLFATGQEAAAQESLEVSHRLAPEDTRLASTLARSLVLQPEPAHRDGHRALALADRLLARQSTSEFVEVRALALAELGDFAQALTWLEVLRQAATQQGQVSGQVLGQVSGQVPGTALARALHLIERYRAEQVCREPWLIESSRAPP